MQRERASERERKRERPTDMAQKERVAEGSKPSSQVEDFTLGEGLHSAIVLTLGNKVVLYCIVSNLVFYASQPLQLYHNQKYIYILESLLACRIHGKFMSRLDSVSQSSCV